MCDGSLYTTDALRETTVIHGSLEHRAGGRWMTWRCFTGMTVQVHFVVMWYEGNDFLL